MEDRKVTYTMATDIPINRETSRIYSPNEMILTEYVEDAIKRIRSIIKKEGFITLERIFRILELRANPECPHVLFTALDNWEFNGELLSLFCSHDFELVSVPVKKPVLREVKKEESPNEETEDPENTETDHEDERRQSAGRKSPETGR